MSSFDYQIHCDEIARYEPTADDWADYDLFLTMQEEAFDDANRELQEQPYEWSDEAIEWEEGFHPDNLYEYDDEEAPF